MRPPRLRSCFRVTCNARLNIAGNIYKIEHSCYETTTTTTTTTTKKAPTQRKPPPPGRHLDFQSRDQLTRQLPRDATVDDLGDISRLLDCFTSNFSKTVRDTAKITINH